VLICSKAISYSASAAPQTHSPKFNEYLRLEPNGAAADETRTLIERVKKATSQTRG